MTTVRPCRSLRENIALTLTLALAAACAACSTPERSRDTANPHTSAQTLALQVCSNCHGVDGNAASPNFPNLAAQREEYFVTQLTAFKSHDRSDPAGFEYMWGLSRNLTAEQIQGLAAYYAKQKPLARPQAAAQAVAAGRQVFEKGVPDKNIPACATCHGTHAEGNGAFPRLAGQHADYIVKQLNVFQRTDQRPEGSVMKQVAHDLTPEHMSAVAAYLETVQTN